MVEEAEDFLAVAIPALLRCFEDAERTFSLDKDDLDCSQLATNAYTHDSDSGEESGEESYGETVHLLSRSIRTEDAAEDSTVESFFSETCHCTLGYDNAPCSQALPRRYAVEYRDQCLEPERDIAVLGQLICCAASNLWSCSLSLSLLQQHQANASDCVLYATVQVTTSARVQRK